MRSPFVTFEEDLGAGRAVAALRLGGAVVLIGGAIGLVASTPTPRAAAMAIIAGLVALWWIVSFVRASRRRDAHVLRLTRDGIELETKATIARVSWANVVAVDLDEDRLVVRVARQADEPLIVEPIGRSQSIYALADAIRAAREAAAAESRDRSAAQGPVRSGGAPPAAPA